MHFDYVNLEFCLYYPTDIWFWVVFSILAWYAFAAWIMRKTYPNEFPDEVAAAVMWIFSPAILPFMLAGTYIQRGKK